MKKTLLTLCIASFALFANAQADRYAKMSDTLPTSKILTKSQADAKYSPLLNYNNGVKKVGLNVSADTTLMGSKTWINGRFGSFVSYSGATSDVNLGTKSITARTFTSSYNASFNAEYRPFGIGLENGAGNYKNLMYPFKDGVFALTSDLDGLFRKTPAFTGINGFDLITGKLPITSSSARITVSDSTVLNSTGHHGLGDYSLVTQTNDGNSYAGFDAKPTISGEYNWDHAVGLQSRLIYDGSGNIGRVDAFNAIVNHTGSGTAGETAGMRVYDPQGSGLINNNYGLKINDQTRGTNNYAIYTGLGNVRFGGSTLVATDFTWGALGNKYMYGSLSNKFAYTSNTFNNIYSGGADGLNIVNQEDDKILLHVANTGAITVSDDLILANGIPTNPLSAVPKTYLDNALTGITWKNSVQVATIVNIGLTGLGTLDSIPLVNGYRVLVKNQTIPSQNGIYIASTSTWSRATDADSADEISNATVLVTMGKVIGGTNKNRQWTSTSTVVTVGADPITFTQISGAGTYSAGTNLALSGNVFTTVANPNFTTVTANLVGNASSATGLETSRTLWGQSFNGTSNVSGSLTGVSDVNASGTVTANTIKFNSGIGPLFTQQSGQNTTLDYSPNLGEASTFRFKAVGTTGAYTTQLLTKQYSSNITAGLFPSYSFMGDEATGMFRYGSGSIGFSSNGSTSAVITSAGKTGLGVNAPTAILHIKAGTASAGTAPIKLSSGVLNTTPESGALEFNGNNIYFTINTTRETIAYQSDLAVTNTTTTALSSATLTSTYSSAIVGFRVICPSIVGGGLIYTKYASGWVQSAITITP